MFTLWLIVAIVLFAISTYCIGRFDLSDGDPVGMLWLSFFGALLWPLVLTAAVIVGPFFGLFWLGDRKREKANKAKLDDLNK
jgi:chromate transport protein ChrA